MRVFLAGATGVIGRPLVPALLGAGHEVTALARTPEKAKALEAQGAEPALADTFDVEGVRAAVVSARAEVLTHQLTALPRELNMRKYFEQLEPTTVLLATQLRGNSNAKAKAQLGFAPRWPRWREGFAAVLAGATERARVAA